MITQSYKLNLIPDNFPVFVRCSQYDTESRTIEMTLYEGSALYTIPNGATVTVRGTKQDKTGFEYPCTFSGSVVSFDIQAQMTIFAGKVPSEIRITSNGEILGSCNFYFLVESTPLDSSTVISESDLPLFEQVAQELPQAIEDIEWLKENINKVYGIKRSLTTSSSAWERTNDSVGLNANATFDGTDVVNDFDNLYPWSKIKTVNMADNGTINAQIGDVNFKFDGTNGEVMTYIPPFYYKRWQDSSYEYIQISNNTFDGASYSEGFYVGRYTTSSGAHSKSGVTSQVSTNITTFRTQATAKGTGWQQMDYHYLLLQMLYLVEYADYNSQTKLGQGVTLSTNTAQVSSGALDSLLMKSGCLTNDGTASVMYRGIENPFGNIWQFVDGLNIKDNVAYINYDPSSYAVDTFDGDYSAVGYTNATANGYANTMGYDSNNPMCAFPISVGSGAGASAYITDYYYQNTGNRIAVVGGAWGGGSGAGVFYWNFNNDSSNAYSYIGSRLLYK